MFQVPQGLDGRALCKGMEYDRHKGIMMPFWSLIPYWVTVLCRWRDGKHRWMTVVAGVLFLASKEVCKCVVRLKLLFAVLPGIASSRIRPHSSTFLQGVLLGVLPGCLFSVVLPALENVVESYQWIWAVAGITTLLKGICSGITIIRMQEYMRVSSFLLFIQKC